MLPMQQLHHVTYLHQVRLIISLSGIIAKNSVLSAPDGTRLTDYPYWKTKTSVKIPKRQIYIIRTMSLAHRSLNRDSGECCLQYIDAAFLFYL